MLYPSRLAVFHHEGLLAHDLPQAISLIACQTNHALAKTTCHGFEYPVAEVFAHGGDQPLGLCRHIRIGRMLYPSRLAVFHHEGARWINQFARGQLVKQMQPVEKALARTKADGPNQIELGEGIAIAR